MNRIDEPVANGRMNRAQRTNLTELFDQQRSLTARQREGLQDAAASINLDSEGIRSRRETISMGLADLRENAAAGTNAVRELGLSLARDIYIAEGRAAEMRATQREITRNHMNLMYNALERNLASSDAAGGSPSERQVVMSEYKDQTKKIGASEKLMRKLTMTKFRNNSHAAALKRANTAADINLFFDILETATRIQLTLLSRVSEEYKQECELKLTQISRAIQYVASVQQMMRDNAVEIRQCHREASEQRVAENQQAAAEREAMKKLDMTEAEAARASELLFLKEHLAHEVKRAELDIQRAKNQQEHEQKSKRYFSIWNVLFG